MNARPPILLLACGLSLGAFAGCELGDSGPWDDLTPTESLITPTVTATPTERCCPTFTPTFTFTPGVTATPTVAPDPTATPDPSEVVTPTARPSYALVINELMASNEGCIQDADGDHPDWVEIYNPHGVPVFLGGKGLSDDPEDAPWLLPSLTLPPYGHLVVFASGKDRVGEELHASFKLSADGERIYLIGADGSLEDAHDFEALDEDISLGRAPDGSEDWRLFTCGSPGNPNGDDGRLIPAAPPEFSSPGGFYDAALDITLTAPEGAEIRYTLDGAPPGLDAPLYTAPIPVRSRAGQPNNHAQIPTNHIVSDGGGYVWKPPKKEIPKATVLRARVFAEGRAPSEILTHTYILDPPISGLMTLPVVSVALDPDRLFSYEDGIYIPGIAWDEGEAAGYTGSDSSHPANYHWRGEENEHPSNITLFEPGGRTVFSLDAGVRIHGNTSRAYPFKSLRFYLRSAYGQGDVDVDLFGQGEQKMERILLRNSGGDFGGTLFKDGLNQSLLMGHTTLDLAAFAPSVLYLNGEYWGIHNLRERLDDELLVERYGLDKDALVILEDEGALDYGVQEDVAAYQTFITWVEEADLSMAASFGEVERQVDLDNFIDYYILQIFVLNQDWPQSNVKYWRNRVEATDARGYDPADGRWRYGVFDTDHSLWDPATDNIARLLDPDHRYAWATVLFRALNESEDFKARFLLRFADLLNGPLRAEVTVPRIDALEAENAPFMPLQIDRWQYPAGFGGWQNKVEALRTFMRGRPDYLFTFLADHYDLPGTAPLSIEVEGEGGAVRVGSREIRAGDGEVVLTEFVGLEVQIVALPDAGARFIGWEEGGSGSAPVLTLTPGVEGLEVEARFSDD